MIISEKWTKENLVKISFVGKRNSISCNACNKIEYWDCSDNFVPVSRPSLKSNGKKTEVRIKTNAAFVKYFLESHYQQHMAIQPPLPK